MEPVILVLSFQVRELSAEVLGPRDARCHRCEPILLYNTLRGSSLRGSRIDGHENGVDRSAKPRGSSMMKCS
jgi:hypothetical protein